MKYINNDGKIVTSTEKAYNIIYKRKGFKPYEDKKVEEKEDKQPTTIGINDMTKADIIDELEHSGIEHDPKALKKELFDLLGSD